MSLKAKRWTGDWPIPSVVRLPGCRVRVVLATPAEGIHLEGTWVYDAPRQVATITINQTLPVEVQRYVLLHELQHAMVDLVDQALERFHRQVMTKRNAGVPMIEMEEEGKGE